MADLADLHERQRAFTAYLRDPESVPHPEDVERRRMVVYRDLIFNNVASLLASTFPMVQRTLGFESWSALARDFLVRHRARTPLFPELPQEFLQFLQSARAGDPRDPPFLLELAHYEWVDLALQISDEVPKTTGIDPAGDLLEGSPVVSPLAWNLTYRFPVHRIGPEHRPHEVPAEATHLVVYRTAEDRVAFMEINAVTQRLLMLLKQGQSSGRAALMQIAAELQHPEPARLVDFGAELLCELRTKGILLGTDLAAARTRFSSGQ